MDSLSDVWRNTVNILGEKFTTTTINTFFSDSQAVDMTDTALVVATSSEFKKGVIVTRYAEQIRQTLSDLFSCSMDLVVLSPDELDDYRENKARDDNLPEVAGYTFDNFVVGPSNRLAHAYALAVAKNPGKVYNPLMIYGNSGLGKTHLLLSIGQYIHERDPEFKIAYVKGDEFTNQLIAAIRGSTQEEFRNKYRNVQLFLMDDIQFISGKLQTQEEFFHTFNALYEAGSQIVITSDRPPIDMVNLEERLRTRFEGGLMADVQPPDTETRMAITRNKATQLGMILSDEVVEFIAENVTANIRQLEGVVKRLTAYHELETGPITIELVKKVIKDIIRLGVYIPTPETIIDETARYYGLSDEDLRGQRRSKNTALARQVSMYLIRTLTNLSLNDIGELYEGRNHATVLSSVRKVENLLKTDTEMVSTIRDISSNINSRN